MGGVILTFALSAPARGQTSLSDARAQAAQIQVELSTISQEAEQAVERYNQASMDLELTTRRLSENEAALEEASAKLAAAQERLNNRMKYIYRDGSLTFIDVIVNTTSFGEFMSRFDLLGRIGSQDKADVQDVLRYKAEVEDTQAALEQDRRKQEELVDTLATEKAAIESRLAEKQQVLDGVEGEIAEIIAQQQEQQQAQARQQSSSGLPAAPTPAPESPPPAQPGEPAPEPPTSEPPPPSSGGAVGIAMQYLGVPYAWGGASPSGFDCSGLVMYVYSQMGIYLPHSAAAQFYSGTPIDSSELAPGDLVFFGSPISHVGIYIGGGSMIHAPFEGAVVSVSSIWAVGGYSGACRL